MNPEREIFLDALDLPQGKERDSFLNRSCGVGTPLRSAVDALLASHQDDQFLGRPALQVLRPDSSNTTDPASRPQDPIEKPGDRIGRYKLLEIIGEGGGGTVFMAEQEEPVRRRVALKVVKPGTDTKSVIARFETERQALAMMDHPNIAKVLDAGATTTGRPFFVMELVRGIRITDYCDENQLTTRERLLLFIKVCQAIQHAHQKGIIHRDIKPSNILVTLHDGVAIPKVIDFGIAKAIDQRLTDHTFFTEFRAFLGTPAYMSPEQAEMSGLDIDTRADIYSLGVVLYEMLTGRTPFDPKQLVASGLDGMRRTIREEEPVRPSTRLRTLDISDRTITAKRQQSDPSKLVSILTGDLDWIALKALEKDRTRRYETANGLGMDVQRYLDDEPVLARPPSTFYRLEKLIYRHRVAFGAIGAVGLTLLGGLALATGQYLEKSRAYERISEAEAHQRRLGERARRTEAAEKALRKQAEEQEQFARSKAYAADINLAQHALAANNLGRARELLQGYRPKAGERDLRHWEWAYLWQNCGSDALFTLCHSSNSVAHLDASHDGRWVAVHSGNGLAIWDLRSRQIHANLDSDLSRSHATFSPVAPLLAFTESSRNAPGPRFHRIRLWDPTDRRYLSELTLQAPGRALAFSRDGNVLLSVSGNGSIETWNISQATRLSHVQCAITPRSSLPFGDQVAVSPDLGFLACSADGGNLRLVDAQTGEVRWTVQAAEETILAMAFSPNSRILATGAGFVESAIRLWDVATGSEIARLEGHRTWVGSLVFWPDGQTLASASADQTIRIWDVSDIQATPATPSRNARRRILRPESTQVQAHAALQGHELEVWSLALLADGTTLVSGSKDGSVCVWDSTRRPRDRSRLTLPTSARTWRFATDSRSVLVIDPHGRATRWQGEDFQESVPIADLGSSSFPYLLSSDGRFALAVTPSENFRVWDLAENITLPDWHPNAPGPLIPFEFSPDSRHVRTRNPTDGSIREWEIETGRETRAWQGAVHRFPWIHIAFTADGHRFIQATPNGSAWLGAPDTPNPIPFELGLSQIGQIAISPDGETFAVASGLGQGALWTLSPPAKRASIAGFLQGIHAITYSPDGKRLAVGSDGREAIKLWDVNSRQELITLSGEGSSFQTVQFSPDGLNLGASNSKGILHIWRAGVDTLSFPPPPSDP